MPSLDDRLVDLVGAPGFVPVAFLLAFAAGAAHAVGPGHGKSLAAAYLVGSDGKVRDAAWLGASVAIMHTLSVLVVALAWTFLSLSDLLSLERLTSGLQLAAGLMVVACETARGTVVLASDAAHLYANLVRGLPFPIYLDEPQYRAAQARALELAGGSLDHLIPGHDPLVLACFPAENDIARVDLAPHTPIAEKV